MHRRLSLLAVVILLGGLMPAFVGVATVSADVTVFSQGFESNANGWQEADVAPPETSATRVASGTHGVPSASGAFHAEGAGPYQWDTTSGSAFTRWGGYGFTPGCSGSACAATFPAGGYTTSVDIYLDPAGLAAASTANDTRLEFDSAINHADGTFGRDFVFEGGYYNDAVAPGVGPRFVFNAGNNAGRLSAYPKDPGHSPIVITATGWYTFRHHFRNNGGVLAVDMSITDSTSTVLHTWTLSDPSDTIATIGGNRYGWFLTNEMPFVAFDNTSLTMAGPSCTTTCYADSATGNDANGGASAGDAKKTIQAAVNQVSVGGTVIVAAGTYPELVTVNKKVTLQGAQAGVDARTRSGSESTVEGPGGDTAFHLTASDVTLDGFTVQNATNGNVFGFGIFVGPGTSGAHIVNNIIENNISGLALANASAADPALVQQNLFRDNHQAGPASGNDIYADQFTAGGVIAGATINENTFTNTAFHTDAWGVGMSNTAAAQFSGLTVSNNTITNHGRGMYFYGTTSSTVSGNTITGASHYGIGLFVNAPGTDSDTAITISANAINGAASGGEGIEVFDGSSGSVTKNVISATSIGVDVTNDTGVTTLPAVTVNRNSITGNTLGVSNTAGGTLDATCNWWGSATGPGSVGPGTGDTVSTNVTFSPWLLSSNLAGPCTGSSAKPVVGFVLAVPNIGTNGTTVTLTSSATDAAGLTEIFYNLFTPGGTFVCNLAHVVIAGAPTSYTDPGTVVAKPMPFAGLDTGVGGPCPAAGIAPGSYVLTANYIDVVGNQVGSPNNQDLNNYPASARFSPVTYVASAPALGLTKSAAPTTYSAVGQVITYTYTIKNTGNVTLAGPFTVSDDHIGSPKGKPFACGTGPLATNATTSCTATYTISQADLDAGSVTNKATATDGTTTSNQATATVNAVQSPALSVVKTVTSSGPYNAVGQVIAYKFVAKNTGNVTLTAVGINDTQTAPAGALTSGPTCQSLASPAGSCSGSTTSLVPGQSATFTATYTITQADLDHGSVNDSATASGTPPSGPPVTSQPSAASVSTSQARSLSLTKSAAPTTYNAVGQVITYTYTIKNTGNVTLAGPFTVSDDHIGSPKGTPFPCGTGPLATNATTSCTATYTISQADLDAGSVTNKATATDGTTTSNQATATVTAVPNRSLSLTKTADKKSFKKAGDVITYTYTIKNTGNVTLAGPFTVSDDHIGSPKGTPFACGTGPLAPGASTTCTATYVITKADVKADSVTNKAIAKTGTTTSNQATATVKVKTDEGGDKDGEGGKGGGENGGKGNGGGQGGGD